jgi:hypothetical protein
MARQNRQIGYWLLAHQSWNIFKPTEYFLFSYSGAVRTRDKKLATRWFYYGEAKAWAGSLSSNWTPILVMIDADEPAFSQT